MKEHGHEEFYFDELANHFIRELQDRGYLYEIDYKHDYDINCDVIVVRW